MKGDHPARGIIHYHIAGVLKKHGIRSVVDVGGNGSLNAFMPGIKVTNANIKNGIDGTNLPYADNSFDAAVSVAVLEHVKGMHKFLSESVRVARKLVVHWFPYGKDAEIVELFKLKIKHNHYCVVPKSDCVKFLKGIVKNVEVYPYTTIAEHLLLLAAQRRNLSRAKLYKYINKIMVQEPQPQYAYVLKGQI
jgi:ubiquinone/menaquinone biosynthesis C-methylase UbiE